MDGNEYLDYLMGFGPILLGYNDPVVNAAVQAQMEEGTIYRTAHPKELEVAQMLIDLIPAVEMLGFLIGGSAATSAAVRLARAYTGRDKVLRCGYHGWHDWSRTEDEGAPAVIAPLTIEVPYGDLDAIEDCFKQNDNEVACLIMETIRGDGPPEGFLQGCGRFGASVRRALCLRRGQSRISRGLWRGRGILRRHTGSDNLRQSLLQRVSRQFRRRPQGDPRLASVPVQLDGGDFPLRPAQPGQH